MSSLRKRKPRKSPVRYLGFLILALIVFFGIIGTKFKDTPFDADYLNTSSGIPAAK